MRVLKLPSEKRKEVQPMTQQEALIAEQQESSNLWDEHVRSVLVQLGLLEPAGLPVVGVEGAKSVLDRSDHKSEQDDYRPCFECDRGQHIACSGASCGCDLCFPKDPAPGQRAHSPLRAESENGRRPSESVQQSFSDESLSLWGWFSFLW
jgi:hypothetical protein